MLRIMGKICYKNTNQYFLYQIRWIFKIESEILFVKKMTVISTHMILPYFLFFSMVYLEFSNNRLKNLFICELSWINYIVFKLSLFIFLLCCHLKYYCFIAFLERKCNYDISDLATQMRTRIKKAIGTSIEWIG